MYCVSIVQTRQSQPPPHRTRQIAFQFLQWQRHASHVSCMSHAFRFFTFFMAMHACLHTKGKRGQRHMHAWTYTYLGCCLRRLAVGLPARRRRRCISSFLLLQSRAMHAHIKFHRYIYPITIQETWFSSLHLSCHRSKHRRMAPEGLHGLSFRPPPWPPLTTAQALMQSRYSSRPPLPPL